MRFLFFAEPSDKTGKAIMETAKTQLSDQNIDLCGTAKVLALKLSEYRDDEKVAILVPPDEEALIEIYSMKKLFRGVPVMLVLPNKDRFIEAMGYRLRPWLTCYRETGVMEVLSKLRSIVNKPHNVRASSMPILSHQ